MTLATWADIWLASHAHARTLATYRAALSRPVRVLGGSELASLKRGDIRALLQTASRAEGKALQACLNAAVREGELERNPADKLPLPRGNKPLARALDPGVLPRIYLVSPPNAPFTLFWRTLAESGLRLGEGLALTGVDLQADHLMVMHGKGDKRRRVDLPPKLVEALREQVNKVVPNKDTTRLFPWTASVARHEWYARLAAVGVKGVRIHDLRHNYAATLLAAGAPMAYVKEQLGHASITITVDTYGHLVPGVGQAWIQRAFGGG